MSAAGGAGVVDLRSDTVTRPVPAMRRAMAEAPVGDDVYGEDPTVNSLERRVAGLLGHEAGLFTPSGSLANQLGLRMLVPPGKELLCDVTAHVVRAELGAAAALSGITTRTWHSGDGRLDAALPLAMMQPDAGPYLVSTAAIAVENTHNFGGGTVQSLEQAKALRAGVEGTGVRLHLDGARLWNAHVATGESLVEWGGLFDTVSVCLSKGLGAPVGSVLVGSADLVAQARVWRKRYGAGMRQAGILAAAGLYALDHHVSRLADDHARARRLAEACADVLPGVVDPASVSTNIVILDLGAARAGAGEVVDSLAAQGVLASAFGPQRIRLVTHLDVDDDATDRAARALRQALSA
ncbi:low specificity L-threonine aldolase [Angustibacter sp. Root456]|uniref:threonine aldolase family protein n=1 Tax=Angustibacter sp. Root456 TaxID=1736539 RepID=UPI0007018D25|nr:GntG family PLP-dependent aldolase [Angustibacter sp. Root456]KQX64423.1 threonine aldolase [Angustibacter sp. Root456]